MKSMLTYLFEGEADFPPTDQRRQDISQLADEMDRREIALKESMSPQTVKNYLEGMEQLHRMECQLFYENGFLTATALALEIRDRLGSL